MITKRVLVADDSEAIREMLGSFLANLGYHTDLAADGEAAITSSSAPLRCGHLRSADAQCCGLAVLAQIKAVDPDVQVIILTGHATLETAIEALRLGAYEYQFKPVEDMEIFARLVERAYHHRSLLRETSSCWHSCKRPTRIWRMKSTGARASCVRPMNLCVISIG